MVSGAAVSPSTSADVWDSQERKMNSFHLRWLRSIFKIPWQDRLTNSAVVLRAGLILLSQVVFFGLAMLDTWNLDAPQTNYCMENWQLRKTALVLQWPLQEKPKAVWHRHHQPKRLCWWWRCFNVCHLKRCEDGWVNSTTNTNQKKKSEKKRRGQHPPSFAPSVVGTVTVEVAFTATSQDVVEIDSRRCTIVLTDGQMQIIITMIMIILQRFVSRNLWDDTFQ